MTITYVQLDHLSLTRLDHAITAWQEVVRKMKEVDESHGPKAQKPFEAAGWSTIGGGSDTAAAAHRQIKNAGHEADAALQQARAIEKVLTETRDSLKAQQKRLHDYVAETTAGGKVRISDQGKVTFTDSVVDDPELQGQPGYGQAVAAELRTIDEIEGEIRKILAAATEVDDSAAAALRYDVGNDKRSFNEHATGNTEKAEDRYDSARAVQLAHKGDKMSNSELKEFNSLLKEHSKDPEFAERFATRMGGQGTLEFWEGMDLHGHPGPDGTRKDLLEQTRSQLGATLATATQSDSRAMQDWKHDVIAAGPHHLDYDLKNPRGFQVMSNLMNSGRYDHAFLHDYGDALIDYEKDAVKSGQSLHDEYLGKTIAGSGLDGGDIDLTNNWGTDPMTGYMNALGHNHQASTDFFSDKTDFDYVVGGGEGDKGARDWPQDAYPQDKHGTSRGYDALGHALESATTGSDYGAGSPELHRGAEERAIVGQVMERYGDPDLGLMGKQAGISDSMGRIGAAYIDDLNYSISGLDASDPSRGGMEELFGTKDENKMDAVTAKQFIRELGHDETSHGIMSQAQQAFTTSRIHAHEGTPEAYRAAEWGMTMHGALDEARAEQIGHDYREGDESYNHALEKSAAWKQAGVSIAVGGATAGVEGAATILAPQSVPIIVPIAEAAGSAVETGLGNEISDSLKAAERDSSGKAINSIDAFDYEAKKLARTGIDNYMDQQGVMGAPRDARNTALDAAYARGADITDTDNSR
ncbi:hypothetical protein [Streptomyces sp. V3I7]|uniref:hypothetical protein n=1 Tax=Streptomyces sp. V3I7 TaxID=3042278 RepID=UPI0027801F62|nr:hypothetical protein [Streptomyces sp. V3I7]MDQ0991128.1 hypothetical protein [Streptomyces sp. V3I7]